MKRNSKSLLSGVKKKKARVLPRNLDMLHMGEEPEFDATAIVPISNLEFTQALNWYNYFCDEKDMKRFVVEFLDSQETDGSVLNILSDQHFFGTIGSIARMQLKGAKLPDDIISRFNTKIETLINLALDAVALVENKVVEKTKPIDEQYNIANAEFDDVIDKFSGNKYKPSDTPFSAYEWLKLKNIKPAIANKLAEYYAKLYMELDHAVNKSDKQIDEAYSRSMKKRAIVSFRDLVANIVADCGRWSDNSKKEAAPRKIRPKTPEQLTRKLKYCKELVEFNIKSINPINIIGASVLWMYNTKNRILHKYVGEAEGLTLRGSTLLNWTVKDSLQKKLRKPNLVLPNIASGGAKGAEKAFNDVKSKTKSGNGRINPYMLLLRAVK